MSDRPREEGRLTRLRKDMQHSLVKGRIYSMPVRVPVSVDHIEFDSTADCFTAVDANSSTVKVGTGFPVPGSELDDLNFVAGDGTKLATEIAGEPARLQFQFA